MFKAILDEKVVSISEGDKFPLLEYHYIEEDSKHTLEDYISTEDGFVLKISERGIEELKVSVRKQRDAFLEGSDIKMLEDFPLTEEERESWKAYRQYLRNIPESGEGWWQQSPLTYEEWKDEPAL